MGMFDSIFVSGVEYQTKAFGKNLRSLNLGDSVEIFSSPMSFEEYSKNPQGQKNETLPNAQVEVLSCVTSEYKWLVIDGGKLAKICEEPVVKIPQYDYYGHPAV